MSDDAQINFNVDSDAKKLAKEQLDYGELSERLRETVEQIAFGEEVSKHTQLQERLRTLREKKDDLRAQRRELDAQLETVEQDIARIEEQLSELDKREDRYEAALEMLEETLAEGGRVFPDHGQVVRAARLGDVDEQQVIADLKERNPSVPEHAFVGAMESSEDWNGFDATEVTR
jgi:chromosome segregation ATPase